LVIKSATNPVYAFILGHTVSVDITSRANIRLVNEKNGYFRLEQVGGHPVTEYKLTLNNPSALGLTSTEGDIGTRRFTDFVLAMNLILDYVGLFTRKIVLSRQEFSTSGNVNVKEVVNAVLESVNQYELDEGSVMSNLRLIDKVDRHNLNHQTIGEDQFGLT
jgi:hypothetical protein